MTTINKVVQSILLVAGIGFITAGTWELFLVNAQTLPLQRFYWDTSLTAASQGVLFAGTVDIGNLAPGDTFGGILAITNTESQNKWVRLNNQLTGGGHGHPDIFADYPDSVDAAEGKPTDNHPATLSYLIGTSGLFGLATPIHAGPFSQSEMSSPFLLRPGQSATVRYVLRFPITAHNDYQAATGSIRVTVMYRHDIDGRVSNNG